MICFGTSKVKPLLAPKPLSTPSKPLVFHTIKPLSTLGISFASKRKLILSHDESQKSETQLKRPKVEDPPKKEPPKPQPKPKPLCNYDSISQRLTKVIDQWILSANAELIKKLISDLRSPTRSCDVFCLIGPSGSGKNVIIRSVIQQLQCNSVVYDDFAEYGSRSVELKITSGRGDSREGFLSKMMQDANEFVFVVDGPDGDMHSDFQRQMIKEYTRYQFYKRPNKSLILLVQSLSSFTLRNWIREVGAYKYYLSTTMKYKEQEFLRQRLHSQCPLSSTEPLQQFQGDFRRMGIDLIACTQEGLQYHRNTNSVEKMPSIFELTRHLMTWPMEPLYRRLVCGDNLDQLLQMCFHNQSKRADNLDEMVRVAQELSDIQMIFGNEDVDKSLLLVPTPNGKPFVDCNRYDISALVFTMYASNLRLVQKNQLQSGHQIQVEFARSFHGSGTWSPHTELDNLELQRFKCV